MIGFFLMFIILIYCLLMVVLAFGWLGNNFEPVDGKKLITKVSVLIPIRNEAIHLPDLLNDLGLQNYPNEHYEVILIDDDSEDDSESIIESYQQQSSFCLQLISLKPEKDFTGSHKKLAITRGVAEAGGELILCTDGDCRLGENWIKAMVSFYQNQHPDFISGPVVFTKARNFWEKLQSIEFSTLIGVGGACIRLGFPTMCNGANMAFTKSKFQEINGYAGFDHIHSGDDEFLMQKIYRSDPRSISFIKSKQAIVATYAQPDIGHFVSQRKRWAGKWKYHKSWTGKLLAVLIFVVNLSLIGSILLGLFNQMNWMWVFVIWGFKTVVDFGFTFFVIYFLQQRFSLLHLFSLAIIYPFYVLYFGITAHKGGFSWKGRKLKS